MSEDRFSDPIEARRKAMDYLARREHGRVELLNKLTAFGFDAQTAEVAVGRLVADGLQSDTRFVETFIRSRIGQGKGPARIRAELRDKGIDDGDIAIGLDDAGEDWHELARDVRLKKFGTQPPDGFTEKARQMRFLQSRGFESGHIQAAVSADPE